MFGRHFGCPAGCRDHIPRDNGCKWCVVKVFQWYLVHEPPVADVDRRPIQGGAALLEAEVYLGTSIHEGKHNQLYM